MSDASAVRPGPAGDRLLRQAVRRGGPWLGLLAAAAAGTAVAETALPAVLAATLDSVVAGRGLATWGGWCAAMIAVLVAADMADDVAAGAATARSTAWVRGAALDRVLSAGVRTRRGPPAGDVVSRVVGSGAETGRVAADVVRALAGLLPAAAAVVALVVIDPWLCLTAVAGVPGSALLLRAFARDASAVAARYLAVQGTIAARLLDALAGIRTVTAAGTAERETARILRPLPELHRHGVAMWQAQGRIAAQEALLVPLVEVAVLAVAGVELARGRITVGAVLAAAQYALLAMRLTSAVPAVGRLARGRAGAARVAEVLEEPVTEYGHDPVPLGTGRLELRDVTVGDAARPLLDGVDLDVPGGALVAVVGPSGAGKSVLAAVCGRLIDPEQGEVRLDGVRLRDLPRERLRRLVAYAFEHPALLGGTVAEAIGLGTDTDPERLVDAARAAQADAFVRRLPLGYGNPMAATPLSGGEAQRLGLARAFARDSRLLILDDAAASLDTVTEHRVATVVATAEGRRTRLVVAHRAATAAGADLVVWLEGGRVQAVGTHRGLWDHPRYRAIFQPGATTAPSAGAGG